MTTADQLWNTHISRQLKT